MITALNPEKLDLLYLYGQEMLPLAQLAQEIFPPDTVKYFRKDDGKDELDHLVQALLTDLKPADQVLLKGSNSMRLAEVVKQL